MKQIENQKVKESQKTIFPEINGVLKKSLEIGGDDTAFNIKTFYKSPEKVRKEEERMLSQKDISEGQYKYIRFLAYRMKIFNKIDFNKIKKLNMLEAKNLIEEIQ